MSYNRDKKPFDKGGRGNFNNRGGDRGGSNRYDDRPSGPLTEIGTVLHPSEATVVCQITLKQKLPFPSAMIYLGENQKVGRVDEVLGPLDDVYISIKLDNGVLPSSLAPGTKIFTTGDKIMPSSRVTDPKTKSGPRGAAKPQAGRASFGGSGGRGGRGGAGAGGRGGFRGGGGGGRGGRGGFGGRR